jgi:hypothetical protein
MREVTAAKQGRAGLGQFSASFGSDFDIFEN